MVSFRRYRRATGRSTESTRSPTGIIQKPSTDRLLHHIGELPADVLIEQSGAMEATRSSCFLRQASSKAWPDCVRENFWLIIAHWGSTMRKRLANRRINPTAACAAIKKNLSAPRPHGLLSCQPPPASEADLTARDRAARNGGTGDRGEAKAARVGSANAVLLVKPPTSRPLAIR